MCVCVCIGPREDVFWDIKLYPLQRGLSYCVLTRESPPLKIPLYYCSDHVLCTLYYSFAIVITGDSVLVNLYVCVCVCVCVVCACVRACVCVCVVCVRACVRVCV